MLIRKAARSRPRGPPPDSCPGLTPGWPLYHAVRRCQSPITAKRAPARPPLELCLGPPTAPTPSSCATVRPAPRPGGPSGFDRTRRPRAPHRARGSREAVQNAAPESDGRSNPAEAPRNPGTHCGLTRPGSQKALNHRSSLMTVTHCRREIPCLRGVIWARRMHTLLRKDWTFHRLRRVHGGGRPLSGDRRKHARSAETPTRRRHN